MYFVDISSKSSKFLRGLDKHISERIKLTLKSKLGQNPFLSDAKFIGRFEGEKVFRIRIGDFRALYMVNENKKIVLVTKIDKKDSVYD